MVTVTGFPAGVVVLDLHHMILLNDDKVDSQDDGLFVSVKFHDIFVLFVNSQKLHIFCQHDNSVHKQIK